jgi:hypothetical protein
VAREVSAQEGAGWVRHLPDALAREAPWLFLACASSLRAQMLDPKAHIEPGRRPPPLAKWARDVALAIGSYALTTLVVLLGATLGVEGFRVDSAHNTEPPLEAAAGAQPDLARRLARRSGDAYRQIVERGYSYDPNRPSLVALFPAYPLAACGVQRLLGVRAEVALLVVSHACWAAALVGLSTYVRRRFGDSGTLVGFVLLAAGLYPPGFYTRMPYSEAMFLLLTVLVLLGIHGRWPLVMIALLVGLATATRPVGVCLLSPLVLDVWRRSTSPRVFVARLLVYGPLAVSGLLAYMAFLHARFDAPLAFAQTQQHYHVRDPAPLGQRIHDLATLAPLREVYDPQAPGYWARQRPRATPIFNILLANPLYFLAALALILVGVAKRWLNRFEWSAAAGLILMPYALRGHEMSMAAMGRFTAVVVPLYLVMGHLLQRIGFGPSIGVLVIAGFMIAVYAALFAAGYALL